MMIQLTQDSINSCIEKANTKGFTWFPCILLSITSERAGGWVSLFLYQDCPSGRLVGSAPVIRFEDTW